MSRLKTPDKVESSSSRKRPDNGNEDPEDPEPDPTDDGFFRGVITDHSLND
jgi:hypothetical protein